MLTDRPGPAWSMIIAADWCKENIWWFSALRLVPHPVAMHYLLRTWTYDYDMPIERTICMLTDRPVAYVRRRFYRVCHTWVLHPETQCNIIGLVRSHESEIAIKSCCSIEHYRDMKVLLMLQHGTLSRDEWHSNKTMLQHLTLSRHEGSTHVAGCSMEHYFWHEGSTILETAQRMDNVHSYCKSRRRASNFVHTLKRQIRQLTIIILANMSQHGALSRHEGSTLETNG